MSLAFSYSGFIIQYIQDETPSPLLPKSMFEWPLRNWPVFISEPISLSLSSSLPRCAGKTLHPIFFSNTNGDEQEHTERKFVEECVQHAGLRHPNIVQLIGVHWPPAQRTPTMVLELLHTSLSSFLEKHSDVPLPFKHRILFDVIIGLQFLHERAFPILHRDLTANNVLLTEDLRAKISDLGMARILPDDHLGKLTKAPGNICYMPPEASEDVYNAKLDIFSFGALILHTVLHQLPVTSKAATFTDSMTGRLVANTETERRVHLYSRMDASDPLTLLSKSCLDNNPELRPTAKDVSVKLESLVARSSGFSSLRLCSIEAEKEKMMRHLSNMESQVLWTLQVLDRNRVGSANTGELVNQLQSVLHGTQSAMGRSQVGSSNPAQRHRLVVSVSSAPLEAAGNSSATHDDTDLLQMTTVGPNSAHPVSLTICRSFSHNFTGTYVKTVLSGLKKCMGLAVREGLLYVVDHNGWNGVHICNWNTGQVRPIIDSAGYFKSATEEKCWGPAGIVLDEEGNIILTDKSNHRVVKYNSDGRFLLTSGRPQDRGDERGKFSQPLGICLTSTGKIIVSDKDNHRLQILNSNLECLQVFGQKGRGNCEFNEPQGVAVDSTGNIHVVDCGNYCVKVFSPKFEFLHKFGKKGDGPGDFHYPSSLCIDERDYVYVTDMALTSVKIFDPSGEFKMALGGKSEDRDEFKFDHPTGITMDNHGHLFVSDINKGRVLMFE